MPDERVPALSSSSEENALIRVLAIDRDSTFLELCRTALANPRFELSVAKDHPDAEVELASCLPDVVVCAHMPPESDGITYLAALAERHPHLSRILVTDTDSLSVANQAYERAKVFRVLLKPHSLGLLRESVEAAFYCRKLSMGESSRQHPSALPDAGGIAAQGPDRSKVLLEQILNTVPAGVLGLDRNGRIDLVNSAALSILGLSCEEATGADPSTLNLPCTGCTATGWLNRQHAKIIKVDTGRGKKKTLFWSCAPMAGENPETGSCVATFQDISAKTLLEKKVFMAKQEIEAIFDSITDPTFLVGHNHTILRANHAFLKYAGLPFDKIIGQRCKEALALKEGSCDGCPLGAVFETGEPAASQFRSQSGSFFRVHYFPVCINGRPVGVVVRYHDVTTERELEAQLLQSEKMAAVGQLIAGVAHEIKNPLAYIFSNLDVLKDYVTELLASVDGMENKHDEVTAEGDNADLGCKRPERPRQADLKRICCDADDLIDECREGAARIGRIAGDLMIFSRKEREKRERADLNAVLDSTINIVWNELKYKCELIRDYGVLPAVLCNVQQIGQVFMNLLVNAAQSMDKRGKLTITTRADGEWVSVKIADEGSGITEENLARLFQPFFTTKPSGKGLGLGLNLSGKLVRAHGGAIRVDSKVGEGSVFEIRLPLSAPAADKKNSMNRTLGAD